MASTRKLPLWVDLTARLAITLVAVGGFYLIRPDCWQSTLFAYRHYVSGPVIISDYLKHNSVRKLQIGAGPNNYPGWLNTDFEPEAGQAFLDVTLKFPLPDQSFDYVYSEHVIEHVNYWEGLFMLRESYRVLKPGGRVRVVTPNLYKLIPLFADAKSDEAQKYIKEKIDVRGFWPKTPDDAAIILNLEMHDFGHQFVYSPTILRDSMMREGFKNVRQYQVSQSDDPNLVDIEARAHTSIASVNRYEALVMEAEK